MFVIYYCFKSFKTSISSCYLLLSRSFAIISSTSSQTNFCSASLRQSRKSFYPAFSLTSFNCLRRFLHIYFWDSNFLLSNSFHSLSKKNFLVMSLHLSIVKRKGLFFSGSYSNYSMSIPIVLYT